MPAEPGTPIDLKLNQPHSARMYDYYLGGKDNYEIDRLAAKEVEKEFPYVRLAARTNRAFMHRAMRFVAESGIRQFLDIGTGIPTEPNLHQVVQSVEPSARVVYVDNDPLVLAHARALLVSTAEGRTAYLPADVTEPEKILAAKQLRDTLDLTQPVALSMFALMHFVSDGDAARKIVATLVDVLPPGSYLVMSHATSELSPEAAERGAEVYRARGIPFQGRPRAEFARFFEGLNLVEPGIVPPHSWRPIGDPPPASMDADISFYAGVAVK